MFLILGLVLAVIWLLCWLAFHIAGAAIHVLIVIAVISVIVHFVRGKPSTPATR